MKESPIQSIARFQSRFEIGAVLGRERSQCNGRVGKAHTLAIGHAAGDRDARHSARRAGFGHDEFNLSVVNQQPMPLLERGKDFRMGQVDPLRVAWLLVGIEHERRAFAQLDTAVLERIQPELRALQVDEDADRPIQLLLDRADRFHVAAHRFVRRVAHVDAENVGAGDEQTLDGGLIG